MFRLGAFRYIADDRQRDRYFMHVYLLLVCRIALIMTMPIGTSN